MTSAADLSPAELTAHSAEHLYYELSMLCAPAARLKPKAEADPSSMTDIVVTNALIESFTTHARVVALFLYPDATKAKYANAITAEHYVVDQARWRHKRGPLPSVLRTVIDRTGKE